MSAFSLRLFSRLILFVCILRISGNTSDLYGIVRCVTPAFDPKILALFYGCYCGPGGQGTPVDAMDRCCQAHDECYKSSHRGQCSYAWYWPVIMKTDFTCYSNQATCTDSQVCPKEQCECDVRLANCLKGMKTPTIRPKCPDYFRAPKAGLSWLMH